MEQDNIDYSNSVAYVGLGILFVTLLLAVVLMGPVGQKVCINSKLEVDTDTIYTEESRWYYKADSSVSPIRIALFRGTTLAPYDVLYLAPDDYVDLKLEEGYSIVKIRTLEEKYPKIQTKSRILQLKPKPIPKPIFNFKRFFE
jgi:hypothetical protein